MFKPQIFLVLFLLCVSSRAWDIRLDWNRTAEDDRVARCTVTYGDDEPDSQRIDAITIYQIDMKGSMSRNCWLGLENSCASKITWNLAAEASSSDVSAQTFLSGSTAAADIASSLADPSFLEIVIPSETFRPEDTYRCSFSLAEEVVTTTTEQPTTTTPEEPTTTTELLTTTEEEPTTTTTTTEPTTTTPLIQRRTGPWPAGTFGLFEPLSGCPSDGTWAKGSKSVDTDYNLGASTNANEASPDNHFQQPLFVYDDPNKFAYQRFCVKSDDESAPSWPKGSYCVNRKGRSCPRGFRKGSIKWDEMDLRHENIENGNLPEGRFGQNTLFYYCCRSDGPADVPVDLPNAEPFYLYRYGGNCQQVKDMNVSNEYIVFDTEDKDNTDAATSRYSPDATLNDIQLEFCYYSF